MRGPALASALICAGLVAGPAPVASAQAQDPSFRVVNRSQNTVEEVFASPASQQNWGQDRLGAEVIRPGGNFIVRLPADGNCVYDVRVVYGGGADEEKRNINTCNLTDVVFEGAGPAPTPPAAQNNPSFNLVNQSDRVIEQLFASPSAQGGWGPDRLGNDVVQPGGRFALSLPLGDCRYDVRVVWRGGDAQERRNLNTCEMNDYVVK